MTQPDQDAVVGRAVRELRDVKEKLAKIRERARILGDSFDTVAHHLRANLEFLRLDGERTDARFVPADPSRHSSYGASVETHTPKLSDLDINAALALRDEVRVALLEKERLEKSLEQMGFRP